MHLRIDTHTIIIYNYTCIYIYIDSARVNATALGLAYPAARGIGSAKTHQIAYMYCFVGISDLKPLTGTSYIGRADL